jgi:hypothetical protein
MYTFIDAPPGHVCEEDPPHPATRLVLLFGFWDGVCVCDDPEHLFWAQVTATVAGETPPWPEERVRAYVDGA